MIPNGFSAWLSGCLLLSLRIAPSFAWSPPFALIPAPLLIRLLLGLGLATAIASGLPAQALSFPISPVALIPAAARELLLGGLFVLIFQLAFGALYLAGRTIDIQAGFGLAVLIDPTTRTQTPLIGTLFAYAAAAIFFAMDGHLELMRMIVASLEMVPIGGWSPTNPAERLAGFFTVVSLLAFGFAGAAILALLLVDMAIALLARTVPQMNVLMFGLQVKTLALLIFLPIVFGASGALLVQLMARTLEAVPRLL